LQDVVGAYRLNWHFCQNDSLCGNSRPTRNWNWSVYLSKSTDFNYLKFSI